MHSVGKKATKAQTKKRAAARKPAAAPRASRPLTPKQTLFISEYLVDLNATQAAIRAGYSPRTAEKIGSENLRKPEIRTAIDAAIESRAERVTVTADEVLAELKRIAFYDVGPAYGEGHSLNQVADLPEDLRRAVSGVETVEITQEGEVVGHVRKLKLADKVKALELLGKHLKLFTERVEHSGAVSVAVVDPYATKGGA